MLVLTRKRSEMIQIGENIVIKVIHTGRSTVKIGIEAPESMRVLRAELKPDASRNLLAEKLRERRNRLLTMPSCVPAMSSTTESLT